MKFFKFFKTYSYDIVRLLINDIGIGIFSLMLYSAATAAADNYLTFAVPISVFSILFLLALLYYAGWDYGWKDKLSVEAGRSERTPNHGLYLGACANAPLVVLSLLATLMLGMHMLFGAEIFYSVFFVINAILRFIPLAMYVGLSQGVFAALAETGDLYFLLQSILLTVLPLLAVGATHLGYRSGLYGEHLLGIFSRKQNKDDE